ncbi:MAG: response regulator [Anaerolineae bacterium]|nr:response regulator [Anaerolineae bacterium]
MLSKAEFTDQIADAYEHLYDLVYLRPHILAELIVPDSALSRQERAWRLHHVLLDVIEELNPGPQAPAFSHEWRRHRLMVLRYMEGLDAQSVADQLAISRRHYYREQKTAIEAVADILWDRHIVGSPAPEHTPQHSEEQTSLDRLELLRLEVARAAQVNRLTQFEDVLQGVISLLQKRLRQHRLELEREFQEPLPDIPVDRNLLRQIFLGILGYLVEHAERATIRLGVQAAEASVKITLRVDPPAAIRPAPAARVEEGLLAPEELAALAHILIHPLRAGASVVGFEVELPTAPCHTILVVDDNEDVLELFQRYLSTQQFHAITAKTAEDALEKACRLQPYAITLDLMMPQQDGWDLLQTLLIQPETRHIPVIVCSVLKQKDLALALGAAGFLEKPITEQALLSALKQLDGA